MKIEMKLLLWSHLLALCQFSAAVSLRSLLRHSALQEPVDEVGSVDVSGASPCSCDCCEVQKLLPMDFKQTAAGTVTSTCTKSSITGASEGATCPGECSIRDDPKTAVLFSTRTGALDYGRFCSYNCQPMTDAAGSACVQFTGGNFQKARAGGTGNGAEVQAAPLMGFGSGFAKHAEALHANTKATATASSQYRTANGGASADAASEANAATPSGQAISVDQPASSITYDMRKLTAERLRSEAGANIASAAASAERVRLNQWSTKEAQSALSSLRIAQRLASGAVDAGAAGLEASKHVANEAERSSRQDLIAGQIFASDMAKRVKEAADSAIEHAVVPCSEQAATMQAEAKGLDRPEDWVKVVAARAADPYQKAVTEAVARTSDYKHLADGLMSQAYGSQKQANGLIKQVNVMKAQGDVAGAAIQQTQAANLLAQAGDLQEQAQGYWKTAQGTRDIIPKWQEAAAQASAYAAWEYGNNAAAFK